jgi:hypothetical protein
MPIAIILKCIKGAVSESPVFKVDRGIDQISGGYQCDYDDGPCLCPYDPRFVQTFDTYNSYRDHMEIGHVCLPMQKRKTRKPCSKELIEKRRRQARDQHRQGSFLNTHVKKQTLLELIRLYDDFVQELFRTIGPEADSMKSTWEYDIRIRPSDLDRFNLDSMIETRNGTYKTYKSHSRSRALDPYYDYDSE